MITTPKEKIDFSRLGIKDENFGLSDGRSFFATKSGKTIETLSPTTNLPIAKAQIAEEADYRALVAKAKEAGKAWREMTAPQRGEIVRQIGDGFREYKDELGRLVAWEMGKVHQEGMGEVQEIIDICDFAVGQSRQLWGKTMPSERPEHRLFEQWHPLGVVGVISAFNFPVAVWAWNTMVAAVCGNVSVWKPSEKTPLCSIGCMKIVSEVLERNNIPPGVFNMIVGDAEIGKLMANDPDINLLSATGSVPMGRSVGEAVAKRMGKSLLELGGNNAIIVTDSADLKLALQATVFAAVGTTGQRCTTARRLFVQEKVYDKFKEQLVGVYSQLKPKIGDPLQEGTLIGPLIDEDSVNNMTSRLEKVKAEGGKVLVGGESLKGQEPYGNGNFVTPAIVEAENHYESVQTETFAPILYMMKYKELDEALDGQNGVPQGLSSSIFSTNIKETERFLSHRGSDCGIANVNIGPSGAEIGGAFGGEKETGGGRESGSDSWKGYMRRQTVTVNYSDELPLAQGIKFEI